jgi:hypothetical protein
MIGPNAFVAILLMVVLYVVGVYDAVALMFYGHTYTVSYVIKSWSREFPIVPILVGLLIGHLFWPVGGEPEPHPADTLHNGKDIKLEQKK